MRFYDANLYLFHADNWDNSVTDFNYRVARCIERKLFVALYAISPDILQMALCAIIRENKTELELTEYENENLEQLVMGAIYYIVSHTFIADREIRLFVTGLGQRMAAIMDNSEGQKLLKQNTGF